MIPLALAVPIATALAPESCLLVFDESSGRTIREPAEACATRVTPASTFKIPHALAALDAEVVADVRETIAYDGAPRSFEIWKRDHDLASAMRYSVVWFFQKLAERLGMEREKSYLKAFDYGNQDASGGLTSFWLSSSLRISPDEQISFLRRFFGGTLPVREEARRGVLEILLQPSGSVVNALGEHPFAAPWPEATAVRAKTGSGEHEGRAVRWLVGRVERGERGWIFVSLVLGDDAPLAAVNLAARRLKELEVLGVR
jgi:beta-lactamase class D